MNASVRFPDPGNDNLVSVRFDDRPADQVLDALKAAGFRFNSGAWVGNGRSESQPQAVAALFADAPLVLRSGPDSEITAVLAYVHHGFTGPVIVSTGVRPDLDRTLTLAEAATEAAAELRSRAARLSPAAAAEFEAAAAELDTIAA